MGEGKNASEGRTRFFVLYIKNNQSTRRRQSTYEDGRNFLPDQFGGRAYIVVGQKVQQVLHVLNPQCQTHAYAEGTVIVYVQRGQFRSYDAFF